MAEDITGPPEIQPVREVSGEEGPQKVPSRSFDSYMKEGAPPAQESAKISPFDLLKEGHPLAKTIDAEAILQQMKTASSSLGDLQSKLHTKNLQLKPSQRYLLRNKLTEASDQIRSAAQATGVPIESPPPVLSRRNPIERFLALVSDGQQQLRQAQENLAALGDKDSLSVPELLKIQFKLSKAQREIEFASVMLGKVLSNLQTLFNVQI